MSSLVFSLSSEGAATLADRELRRNGVGGNQIRILGKSSRPVTVEATSNPANQLEEFKLEIAQGRVLLEVIVDEQNQQAVERLVAMLGADARKFVIGHHEEKPAVMAHITED